MNLINDKFWKIIDWFKKYRLTFFDFSSLKNKRLIDDLLIYFEQEREGFTNWKWLVLDYYSVGRTNQPFKMFDIPNFYVE